MTEENKENHGREEGRKQSEELDDLLKTDWLERMKQQRKEELTPIEIDVREVGRDLAQQAREYSRKNRITGGQWAMFFAGILAFWLSASAEGGFNVWVFLILLAIFALVLAPFRVASWAKRRINSRPCHVCGMRIANGQTVCSSCGTDYLAH